MTGAPAAPNPFTPEQQAELRAAARRAAKVRRACRIAKGDAWMTALFAAITLAAAVISPSALVVGIPLAAIAWNAFAGESLMRRFDLRGPRRLGVNQLLFMAVIFAYCIWQIVATLSDSGPIMQLAAALTPYLQLGGTDTTELVPALRIIVLLIYGAVIVASFLTQGLMAWYYFSRGKLVRAYLDDTPQWVIDVQQSTG